MNNGNESAQTSAPLVPASALDDRFEVSVDLGLVIARKEYRHDKQIARFKDKYRNYLRLHKRDVYDINFSITDENFSSPSYVIRPGDMFHVIAHVQKPVEHDSDLVSPEEVVSFLDSKGAVYPGVQGLTLLLEDKWENRWSPIPTGKIFVALDKLDNLWKDSHGHSWVPCVIVFSDSSLRLCLANPREIVRRRNAYLEFQKVN